MAVKDTIVGNGDGGSLHGDQASHVLEIAIGEARSMVDHVVECDRTHIGLDPMRLE